MSERTKKWLYRIIVLAVLIAVPQVIKDRYFMHIVVISGIFMILCMSWNLLAGSITTLIKRGLNSAYKAVLSKTHRALLK